MFRLAIVDQTVAAINPWRLIRASGNSSFANNFLTQSVRRLISSARYGLRIGHRIYVPEKEQRNQPSHSEPIIAPLSHSFWDMEAKYVWPFHESNKTMLHNPTHKSNKDILHKEHHNFTSFRLEHSAGTAEVSLRSKFTWALHVLASSTPAFEFQRHEPYLNLHIVNRSPKTRNFCSSNIGGVA